MALDPRFVVTQDLDSYFVDKDTGLPLAGGILTFYEDEARTVLKDVYTLTGAPPYSESSYVPLPNPIILSSVGTVQDAGGNNVPIYYFPYQGDQFSSTGAVELYYVTVTDSAGEEQFTREAWPNPQQEISPIPSSNLSNFTENQLSNPTFTNVLINPVIPTTYTVSTATQQIFAFAPNWDFVISGTGTVVVQQIPIAGNSNLPSSPPYVIDVTVSTGITQCLLRQRLAINSGLWASTAGQNIFLSGSFVAQNQAGGTVTLPMYFLPSSGSSAILIFSAAVTPVYEFFSGGTAAKIPDSSDANSGQAGYVDIYISFPFASEVQISAIQVIPSLAAFSSALAPDLNSSNRDEVFQGDYYIPRNNAKPTDSYLVGWDFPKNPYQLGASSVVTGGPGAITTTAKYIADQTIAVCSGANVNWARAPITAGLSFTTTDANNSFYIMQYLRASQVSDMIGSRLSVNIFGYQTDTLPTNPITMKIYLFSTSSAATPAGSIPTLPTVLGTIDSLGNFTLTPGNGWIPINRSGLNIPQIIVNAASYSNGIFYPENDYGFSGWDLTLPIQTTPLKVYPQDFAIIVTFSYVTAATSLVINSISCVPGDLPCRPATKTFDETLRQCQFYYQKSFIGNQPPVQNLGFNTGESYGFVPLAASSPYPSTGPIIRYATTMRATPNPVTLYNPGAANTQVRDYTHPADWSGSTITNSNQQGFFVYGTVPMGSFGGDAVAVHWSADARLGVVA